MALSRRQTDVRTWRPYDLVVVKPEDADPAEHFIMAADGVVRIAAGQPTSCMLLADWRQEAEQFERLCELGFFRHFLSCRCFRKWRQVSDSGDALVAWLAWFVSLDNCHHVLYT